MTDRLRELARELVDRYTKRQPVSERHGGCGWCGGLPHTAECLVGRFEEALVRASAEGTEGASRLPVEQVQLLAWAVVNSHTLARRALARSTSVYDREKWEHVLRICEKAGARSQGVLRASVPTEITDGSAPAAVRAPLDEQETHS